MKKKTPGMCPGDESVSLDYRSSYGELNCVGCVAMQC
jgi:hypothetical protein